jgi:hypothetical protein
MLELMNALAVVVGDAQLPFVAASMLFLSMRQWSPAIPLTFDIPSDQLSTALCVRASRADFASAYLFNSSLQGAIRSELKSAPVCW